MKYAVNSSKMKMLDEYTTEVIKIPSLVLMERAAMEVAAVMKRSIKKTDRILVVCGPGNNGGDGVAAGRILYLQGYLVAILLPFSPDKCSEQMKLQLTAAKNLGIPVENCNKLHEYNIIIDAVFGIGLKKPVEGIYEEIIHGINEGNNTVFSVDIPSGISADTGRVMNEAVRADHTITFGYMKIGLLLYPGAQYAGEITVADIGFPESALLQAEPDTFYYTPKDLCRLPERKNYSHKGTYGRVLVIAGSKGMCGAAYLSAKAAYRTGAGLVKILTASENRTILQTLLPEALFASYDRDQDILTGTKEEFSFILDELLSWASVIVIGPGLGMTDNAQMLLNRVLSRAKVPVIIDADAITMLAEQLDASIDTLTGRIEALKELLLPGTVLTPHLMELSRLIKIPVREISDNIIDTANQCTYNNEMVFTIKDARTVVAGGSRRYINLSGNNGMATGGSGDVLAGIMAALIAQGMQTYDAACLAVYLHGLAGDKASDESSTYSLMAGDIADAVGRLLAR